ncbi:protein-glutamate O-methyltransferase CheR [Flavobacterium sp. MAH-1]|uniref:Protein-glutamate O-methyltransferase CheR n=1 Tax=Flavobacterium agri TaxID=2743471 RepID=A0A7Y9C650_9FLAO|nr:protein-glutamate O-methyltransferase CheR [Flavobacterium agri]NUY79847.1 protein-glutamate O-methyltransferase CheR [Flavobacterium agri]NYA69872.1 protein-glutamate O-methyltransferase CheR [Flavobacterium agri]
MTDERELDLLINEVYEYYGYDFSGYSQASFGRRISRLMEVDGFKSFADFLSKVRSEPEYFKRMVEEITVNVTEMFRDPAFYRVLRTTILPELATKPFIRIWHAGCSTGEEVYSMAIMLEEANLMHKALLYATDINPQVLETAKKGIFPLRMMKEYSENYVHSGGKNDFSGYYTANYGFAKFNERFTEKMVFAQHNLVSDRSFNEFDLILCRNVLIYFDKQLQDHALSLFDESLANLGYLALGTKESIKFSSIQKKYQQHDRDKIWKKIK